MLGSSPLTRGKPGGHHTPWRTDKAHPRSRGENGTFTCATRALTGSSPLTRGKQPPEELDGGVRGLIPAHAGKTASLSASPTTRRAHPRSRGENVAATVATVGGGGSSPLTRGKRAARSYCRSRLGLIPAHAGKTPARFRWRRRARAHPRSRGENVLHARDRPGFGRLIPAHAGKTGDFGPGEAACRAHPRSRGENRHWCDALEGVAGSSPLTRGKRSLHPAPQTDNGLIPAHAGKTNVFMIVVLTAWAHPRSRGENPRGHMSARATLGSSPLTRGKHLRGQGSQPGAGLIPAHAGKTCRGRSWHRRPRAHPRSRGENRPSRTTLARATGSSPLTRGKLPLNGDEGSGGGLIPAHAGKNAVRRIEQNQEGAHPRSRGEYFRR